MNPKATYLVQLILSGLLFCSIVIPASAQNLIYNPGAELDPIWNGWTQVSGNWRPGADVAAKAGNFYFFAGLKSMSAPDGTSELIQDVDVSGNAINIDAALATYTFSSWMRIYEIKFGTPNDRSKIIVEYRDASAAVLATYDTGNRINTSWTNYTDTRKAPAGTRTIRTRLISVFVTGTESDGYMDDLSLTVSNASITPIELLSFDAVATGDSIAVIWATANELNNAYFTIEKSSDAVTWTDIEKVSGAGTSSSIIEYIAYDDSNIEGTSYYRLKQTDVDGSFTYSGVAAVHNAFADVLIYPNPVRNELHVGSNYEQNVLFSCTDITGQEVRLPSAEQNGETLFDTSELNSGVYF